MRLLDDIRHIHQGADVHRAILQGEALQSFGQVQQISERTVDQRIHGSQHFAGSGDIAAKSRMVAEEVPLRAVQLRIEIIGGIDQLLGDVRQTLIAATAKCRIGQTFGGCQHALRIRGHSRDGCRVERAHTGDAGQQRQQQYNHHSRPYRRTADQRTAVTTHVLGSLQVYGTRLLIHSAIRRCGAIEFSVTGMTSSPTPHSLMARMP